METKSAFQKEFLRRFAPIFVDSLWTPCGLFADNRAEKKDPVLWTSTVIE
jgi:hypothetical protein